MKILTLIKIAVQKVNTNELSTNAFLEKHLKNGLVSRAIYNPRSLTSVEKLLASKLEFNKEDKKSRHLLTRFFTSPLGLILSGSVTGGILREAIPLKPIKKIQPHDIISSLLSTGSSASMLAKRNTYAAKNIKKLLDTK